MKCGVLLAVLLFTGCAAQGDPLLAPERPTKQIRLTVVVQSSTGVALDRAAVTTDGATQITTATGVVVFKLVARQTYTVTVLHADYQTWTHTGRWTTDWKLSAALVPRGPVSVDIVADAPILR
jgi:hypothetical protein